MPRRRSGLAQCRLPAGDRYLALAAEVLKQSIPKLLVLGNGHCRVSSHNHLQCARVQRRATDLCGGHDELLDCDAAGRCRSIVILLLGDTLRTILAGANRDVKIGSVLRQNQIRDKNINNNMLIKKFDQFRQI